MEQEQITTGKRTNNKPTKELTRASAATNHPQPAKQRRKKEPEVQDELPPKRKQKC